MSDEERKKVVVEDRDDDCREMIHVHAFDTMTTAVNGHSHNMTSVSAPARLTNGSHIHRIKGRTTYDDGHWHAYDVFTGPAIEMPDGTHTHYFEGVTSEANDHVHEFADVTSLAPDIDGVAGAGNSNIYKYPKRKKVK